MNVRFDPGQGRAAPARETSGRPAVRRYAQVSADFLSRRRSTLMLRRILIASAAAAMLLVTFTPDDTDAGLAEVAAIGAVAEPTAVALSQFEDLGAAALSQCG